MTNKTRIKKQQKIPHDDNRDKPTDYEYHSSKKRSKKSSLSYEEVEIKTYEPEPRSCPYFGTPGHENVSCANCEGYED